MPQSPNELDDDGRQVPSGDVHVWSASVAAYRSRESALLGLLADDEIDRANRFVFEKDRLSFVLGRATLRTLLGRCLSKRPQEVQIVANCFGKPELERKALFFNTSHSGDVVLIALCRDHEIGVDVERVRHLEEMEQLATKFFSPREVSELRAAPPQQMSAAFFACWTRKEAYVKARGHGLSVPLAEFDVPTSPDSASDWRAVQSKDSSRWYVRALPTPGDYFGALAAPVPGLNVCYREYLP
ncbi:MAG: 4'-phosphopantetheinyl transferase superfamily protein [Pirellulaceae bacterium]|jgi:4'-phosphopantetheinyl transferase|nr:phosphopantetheine-protein transferase [Planctomycetaceae bacterium]MDP6553081.1 4'-phosphopantetheinyl transferase superfamily protein [Pirellulaceae bacterium]